MSFASGPDPICDRPGCNRPVVGDWLYCSESCYDADNDPTPVILLAETDPKYVARKWSM